MHWQLYPQDEVLTEALAASLNISTITAQVLINRGIKDADSANEFLNPTLQGLHDPFLMAGMEDAVSRIISAISGKEHITIYGDYDTDGATSTALLVRFFDMIGVKVDHYIPHRIKEGYGMHMASVKTLHERRTDLIITVDNGINAVEEISYAKSLGIDVIVTDHHEPSQRLPEAVAIINPKRGDCSFPFKGLAGVGVAFNLVMALRQKMREREFFKEGGEPRLRELLDIVAIGTVADVVPLMDENRIFVKFGLEELKKSSNKGLIALRIISGLEPHQINASSTAFRLAPRINAAGRLEDQEIGVRLLTTKDPEEATELAQTLHSLNSKRQSIEAAILKETSKIISEDKDYVKMLGLTLAGDNWHPGVIGIVATRIAEEHKKPAVVISLEGDKGLGSVRSIGDYNVIEALRSCGDLLMSYGGHKHAAGLTIAKDKIDEFTRRFNEYVSSTLSEDDRIDTMFVDNEISSGEVSEELIEELERMEPFGEKNPEPVFCLREMKVSDAKIVAEKHLKLKFAGDMVILDAIGFGMGHHGVAPHDVLDVAFVPQRDTWRGAGAIQLKLRDLKMA
ncbi:MAG: single-stranded-DNA-specific exonuclease RecJ [Deltaproteobacteria bacterium CG11_big_fil_rev_8_21_14_0_20_49_13]|nr:MAG: single-stranded-DNA-specific exonuclease RecJ [Deltaproteobacteria bacterium CG11_big_fil_rev_8_21_14_0_20_49_13]